MRTLPRAAKLFFLGTAILTAAVFFRNYGAVAKLRTTNQNLLAASQEVKSLTPENQEIERLRPLNNEAEKLRDGIRDLPKLRNEVRILRERFTELKTLRVKNDQLLAQRNKNGNQSDPMTKPEGFLSVTELFDAGLGSPESTVQTYFWAMSRGNVSRMYECSGSKPPVRYHRNGIPFTEQEQLAVMEEKRIEVVKEMANFPGYRIAEKKIISADVVEVSLQSTVGGIARKMRLKRTGNEWKMGK